MTETTTENPGTSDTSEGGTVRLTPQEMHAPLFWDVYRNKPRYESEDPDEHSKK
jgi:hypothetical protein